MMRLPLLAVFALAAAETPKACTKDSDCPKGKDDAVTHFCRLGVAASGVACDKEKGMTCAKLSVRGESCGGTGLECFRNKCAGALECRKSAVDSGKEGVELPGTCAKQCEVGDKKVKVFEGWRGPVDATPEKWCQTLFCDGSGSTDVGKITGDTTKKCPTDIAGGLKCCVEADKPKAEEKPVCCGATGQWITLADKKGTAKKEKQYCAHALVAEDSKAAPFGPTCTNACSKEKSPATDPVSYEYRYDEGWTGPNAKAGEWCNKCACTRAALKCTDHKCPALQCCEAADKTKGKEQVCCGATGKWVTKDDKGMVTCHTTTKKYTAGMKVEEPFHNECSTTRECMFFSNVKVTVADKGTAINPRPGQGCNTCTCNDGKMTCETKKCDAPKCCDPEKKPPVKDGPHVCCGLDGAWTKADAKTKCGSHVTEVDGKPATGYPFFKACDKQCAANLAAGGPDKKVALGWTGPKLSTKAVTAKWCDTCTCAVAAGAPAGTAPVVTCTTHAECPKVNCCPAPAPKDIADYACCGVTRRWVKKAEDGKVRCAGVSVDVKSKDAPLGEVCDVKKSCTLPGGAVLENGRSGRDTGAEWCKKCRCTDGKHECTKDVCKKQCCAAKQPSAEHRCCGASGQWAAKDAAGKYKCGDALVADGVDPVFPGKGTPAEQGVCAPTPPAGKCKLHNTDTKKVEVAQGWTGFGLGDNWCNTCKCREADLGKPVSCPKHTCPTKEQLKCCSKKPAAADNVCCGLTGEWVAKDGKCGPVDLKIPGAAAAAGAPITAACKMCMLEDKTTVAPGWSGYAAGDNWCNKCYCLKGGKLNCHNARTCPKPRCCRDSNKPTAPTHCCGATGSWVTEVKGELTCAGHTIKSSVTAPLKPFTMDRCPTTNTCTIKGVKGAVHVGWVGKVDCNYCACLAKDTHRCTTRTCK